MTTENKSADEAAGPAAIFASALSLWQACQKHAASDGKRNLSQCYKGMDQFMREVMRVANKFETWACSHIDFDQTNGSWPYFLEDKFGIACLEVLSSDLLAQFDDSICLRVAMRLSLPIKLDGKLPIPIDVRCSNPTAGSAFGEFRIQTLRNSVDWGEAVPFTQVDEPFDEEFGDPYFGLYGLDKSGLLEHIADRKTYSEAVQLAEKLAPGVDFPKSPTSVSRSAS